MQSHPSWVRGLKHAFLSCCRNSHRVAPLVGAWIETSNRQLLSDLMSVAPLVGAWIETLFA